jgi:hypothetical protein
MEHEGPLLCSQEPAIGPYPKPDKSICTPKNRILREKLTVTELVKTFPTIYGTWRFIIAFTRSRHRAPSWARWIQLTNSKEKSSSWETNSHSASQDISRILWNPKVHYRVYKSTPHGPILSQMNPFHGASNCCYVGVPAVELRIMTHTRHDRGDYLMGATEGAILITVYSLGNGLDNRGSIPRKYSDGIFFSLRHRVQAGYGAHSASYPRGTRGSFPGGKADGMWSW